MAGRLQIRFWILIIESEKILALVRTLSVVSVNVGMSVWYIFIPVVCESSSARLSSFLIIAVLSGRLLAANSHL